MSFAWFLTFERLKKQVFDSTEKVSEDIESSISS